MPIIPLHVETWETHDPNLTDSVGEEEQWTVLEDSSFAIHTEPWIVPAVGTSVALHGDDWTGMSVTSTLFHTETWET